MSITKMYDLTKETLLFYIPELFIIIIRKAFLINRGNKGSKVTHFTIQLLQLSFVTQLYSFV